MIAIVDNNVTITMDKEHKEFPIIYTDDLSKNWMGASFDGKTIKIRPKFKGRKGILFHEIKHAEQFLKNPNHMKHYEIYPVYRYNCEIEAYGQTIKYNGYRDEYALGWIVDSLFKNYDVPYNKEQILNDLKPFLLPKIIYKQKPKNKKNIFLTLSASVLTFALIYFFGGVKV